MNVQLFFEASDYPILQYWIIDKKTDEIEMALRLVKTQHFHDWYRHIQKERWINTFLIVINKYRLIIIHLNISLNHCGDRLKS